MTPDQAKQFPPERLVLGDGRRVRIRILGEADAAALGELFESVPLEDARFFYSPGELNRERAATEAAQASGPFAIALGMESEGGALAGYAFYRWTAEDSESSTFGVCIRRDHQGAGAGTALMLRLFEIAKMIGPPRMSLTVQKANGRAVALYRKMGFRTVREQTRAARDCFPEEPEYYMERQVR